MTESMKARGACVPRRRRVKPTADHASVARACKALGDENRLTILQMLADAGELCVCDIEANFELSQPTISHHLRLLRQAGLIEGERRSTWIYYRLVPGALEAVVDHPLFRSSR